MSVVANLMPLFIEAEQAEQAQAQEQFGDDQKIGSLLLEGGGAGADIWAYNEDDDTYLEFQGWRADGSWWTVECRVDESIEKTLKAVCTVASDLDQPAEYIRVTSIVYSVDMPDCTMTRSGTLNQCMDFPDQRWVDVRDQEQWYDVHMVVRRC